MNKVTLDLSGLEKLEKSLPKGMVTKIGVLSEDNSRQNSGTMGNAEIGLIHELGSFTKNIPARSWLIMPLTEKKKVLEDFLGSQRVARLMEDGDFEQILTLLGLKAEEVINDAFTTGGFGKWAANSAATVKKKGSSRPLVDQGQLRRAVSSEVSKDDG